MAGWRSRTIAIGTPLVRETMAMRLKALEDENAKLKKLLAEAMLDNAILKDVAAKKW